MLVPDHDNAIVGSNIDLRSYNPDFWREHLRRYWDGVRGLLNQVIAADHDVEPRLELNLQEVETYFEFTHQTAVAQVAALQEAIIATRAQVTTTFHSISGIEHGVVENSRCITIRRTNAIKLKLYAKTNNRIRLEVTHNLRDHAGVLGRHTSQNLNDLFPWLERLAEDAADVANGLLDDLQSVMVTAGDPASPAEFVRAVINACRQGGDPFTILELLCVNGRIVVGTHDPLLLSVRRLVQSRVILSPPRRSRDLAYPLTPRYAQAAADIRALLFPLA